MNFVNTKAFMLSDELSILLESARSKQVYAFAEDHEDLGLDEGKDYLIWAEQLFLHDDLKELQDALYPLLQFSTSEEINHGELWAALHSLMRLLKIRPPRGSEARKLFLLGYLQENRASFERETCLSYEIMLIWRMIDDDPDPAFFDFNEIAFKQFHDHIAPWYFYGGDVKNRDLMQAADEYLTSMRVEVREKEGWYEIVTVPQRGSGAIGNAGADF